MITTLVHSCAGADLVHRVDRALFEHSGADPLLDVLARLGLEVVPHVHISAHGAEPGRDMTFGLALGARR